MRTLTLDIVDYPGEWLLDLPLLDKSYEQWSAETLALSAADDAAAAAAARFSIASRPIDPLAPADEYAAIEAARLFTDYLQACRKEHQTLSMIGPGPLPDAGRSCGLAGADLRAARAAGRWRAAVRLGLGDDAPALRCLSRRRGAAVLPRSFRAARPADRAGRCAGRARRRTRGDARSCRMRWSRCSIASGSAAAAGSARCFRPRADRILFAATKADQLHHSAHDRLEAILKQMTESADRARRRRRRRGRCDRARRRPRHARSAGARRGRRPAVDRRHRGAGRVEPTAGISTARPRWRSFPAICRPTASQGGDFRSIRFRPPALEKTDDGIPALPHIRLDRALQFLIGDRLR